jgi:nucleotide-binding universal stress UspA family protein
MLSVCRLLVPVNFTPACRSAAEFAVKLASRCNVEFVQAVHVVEPSGSAIGFETASMVEQGLQAQRERARLEMEAFLPEGLDGVILEGDPATEIARFARNERFDLILMPTRGHGVFRRLLLGSVTAKVLHDANCPVWTGVHPEGHKAGGEISVEKIACAVDLGPQTRGVLDWAARFASDWQAEMSIVHLLPALADTGSLDRLASMARGQLRELLEQANLTRALVHVEYGDVRRVLPVIVKRLAADVLVAGRGAVGAGARLGGSAYAIVRDSPCPVVSV